MLYVFYPPQIFDENGGGILQNIYPLKSLSSHYTTNFNQFNVDLKYCKISGKLQNIFIYAEIKELLTNNINI